MSKLLLLTALLLQTAPAVADTQYRLCNYSSHGRDTCLQRLAGFISKNGEEPITDDDLMWIYGCLLPLDNDNRHKNSQLDLPGC